MSSKTIYLVRHGETLYNRHHLHQGLLVPLSDLGKKQAQIVAQKIKDLKIDTLISSDLTRAKQTAEFIAEATGKRMEVSNLFGELVRPTEMLEKHFLDPRALYMLGQTYLHSTNLSWHYSDEENFAEFRNRARSALRFLEEHEGGVIAVVSHRIFIGAMLSEIACGAEASMGQFVRKSLSFARLPNTAVIKLSYDSEREDAWRVEPGK